MSVFNDLENSSEILMPGQRCPFGLIAKPNHKLNPINVKTNQCFKTVVIALLMALVSLPLSAQTITVTGTVVDSSEEPLTGATVAVKGTQNGASTDLDGKFTLTAPSNGTLVVSYIGYTTQEIKINGQTEFKIVLQESSTVLDEVVTVGYGTQKKVNMTGAVSSVKVGALEDRPVTNATNALAGLSAGLSIVNSGGNTPGYEQQTIRVRGVGTFNNADPLVVIDGLPNASISDINPLDIESISVLKDAASSAIYGSRAANGVILITTKKGKAGTARVTYSGNVSFETMAKRFDIVSNYADYMEIQNQARANNGVAARFSQEKINEWRNDAGRNPRVYPNTDWQDHAFRDVNIVQNHNISVTGGTETVRYNMSLGYIHNPGMTTGTQYSRYQMRSNLEVDIKPWITAGMNIYGFIDSSDTSADNATNGGDVVFGYGGFNTVPGMNLYDKETGTYGGIQNPEEQNVSNANPYRRNWFFKNEFPNKTRSIIPKMYLRVKPVKGLTVEASYTYNYKENNLYHILTDKPLYRYVLNDAGGVDLYPLTTGLVRNYVRRYNYWWIYRTSDITANYNFKAFNDKLDATILLGAAQEYQKYEYDTYLKYDGDQSLSTLDAYPTVGRTNGYFTEWALRSYFGRVNFVWDDKYMLEGNLRADGSSRFAPGHRWGWFPSVSAGWRISEENFMENSRNWLSSLKLRASYGGLGNNTVGNYAWQALYNASNTILGNTINAGYYQALSNTKLSWETTYVTNVGIDYGLFDGRLSGSLEYYDKDTKGILMSIPAPYSHGTTAIPTTNAGRVKNNGFEIDGTWTDRIGNVTYNIGFNLSYNHNEIKEYGGQTNISGVFKNEEGKPINQLYVMDIDRIVRDQNDLNYVQSLADKSNAEGKGNYFATFQRPQLGDFLYKDTNGDGKLDYNDRIEVGSGNFPAISYGFNLGATWKDFSLQLLFQGVGDYNVYYNNQAFRFITADGQTIMKDIVENSWTPENPYGSKYPILRYSSDSKNQVASTAFVHNASYLRLKNLTFSYNLPQSISKKFFVENLKVYTSMDNLFTITSFPGWDPEIVSGVGYPSLRQMSLGVNVTF